MQGLYLITDGSTGQGLLEKAEQGLRGGAALLQYRDKTTDLERREQEAAELRALCHESGALFIVNDDMALARKVQADGVHLGRHDAIPAAARAYLGKGMRIGISCYNQLALALEAQQEGADYVAFGSFFTSPTKPDAVKASQELLHQARGRLNIPICAIGGIRLENAPLLLGQGADMLAVISDVFNSPDIVRQAAHYKLLWQGSKGIH